MFISFYFKQLWQFEKMGNFSALSQPSFFYNNASIDIKIKAIDKKNTTKSKYIIHKCSADVCIDPDTIFNAKRK